VKRLKLIVALLWLGLLLLTLMLWWRLQLPLRNIPALLEQKLRDFGLHKAAVVYMLIFAIRPLILFPASFNRINIGRNL
jgi:uncharacterized membrane protein YdjX (TVP38/TMEM64 family)